MIFGPDIETVRDAAKTALTQAFVSRAEEDGTPPTLRAMYVLKTAEARICLAGGSSSYIEQEAALRGIPAAALAQRISDLARASEGMELERMRLNVAIDAAADESAIDAILKPFGIVLSIDA